MSHAILAAGNPLDFLTQFGVEWKLLVSQALSFGIVAAALYFFVFRPVISVSAKRQQEIEQGLKDAETARAKLASAQEEADSKLRKTAQEASKILEQARDNAKKTIEEAAAQANQKAAQIRESNEAQIARDKQLMKEELSAELSALVVKATEAVVGDILSQQQRGELAELAVKKLSQKQ